MPWIKLADEYPDHPKVRAVGAIGLAIQTAAICHCGRYLTDGFLSYSSADALIRSVLAPITRQDGSVWAVAMTSGMRGQDAEELDWKGLLVEAELWESAEGGYLVHDYLKYNPSRRQVLKDRRDAKLRMEKSRSGSGEVPKNSGRTSPVPSPSLGSGGNTTGGSTRVAEADAGFLAALRDNPAYRHIDLEQELGRMRGWLSTPRGKGRKLTRQFIVNWLNKIDRPVEGAGQEGDEWRKGLNLG